MTLSVPCQCVVLGLRVAVLLLLRLGHRYFAFNDLAIDLVPLLIEHSDDGFFVLERHETEPSGHQRSVDHDHTLLYLAKAAEVLAQ